MISTKINIKVNERKDYKLTDQKIRIIQKEEKNNYKRIKIPKKGQKITSIQEGDEFKIVYDEKKIKIDKINSNIV